MSIEQIRAREQAATKGPWELDSLESGEHAAFAAEGERLGCGTNQVFGFATKENAEFITHARNDIPALLAALDAVAALHQPIDALMYAGRSQQHKVQVCTGCGQDDGNWNQWPCPTIQAITTALSEATN